MAGDLCPTCAAAATATMPRTRPRYEPAAICRGRRSRCSSRRGSRGRRDRHLAGRADDDAAGDERRRSASPARCSTTSAPISSAGLERIRGYVGQGRSFPTWMHAARGAAEEAQRRAIPTIGVADWLAMAKRLMTVGSNGRIVFDYDMKIAEPLRRADRAGRRSTCGPRFARWPGRPVLLLRGELSTCSRPRRSSAMAARAAGRRGGHGARASAMRRRSTNPQRVAAIERLLARSRMSRAPIAAHPPSAFELRRRRQGTALRPADQRASARRRARDRLGRPRAALGAAALLDAAVRVAWPAFPAAARASRCPAGCSAWPRRCAATTWC